MCGRAKTSWKRLHVDVVVFVTAEIFTRFQIYTGTCGQDLKELIALAAWRWHVEIAHVIFIQKQHARGGIAMVKTPQED